MTQTYEYYIVDPGTWKDSEKLNTVTASSIDRDADDETLGSASIDMTSEIGECYIRIYLIIVQNGVTEKYPLGTYLVQTPSFTFNGKITERTLDAYSPLLELKENAPDYGYTLMKKTNIMNVAGTLTREHTRAPVITTTNTKALFSDFTADTNDTWLTFLRDLISDAKYEFSVDPLGNILFAPIQSLASMQHIWEYTDDNSSILYPDITYEQDLYGIPNVVEVIYSSNDRMYVGRAVNSDPDSIVSTVNRGREILYRETSPSFTGTPTKVEVQQYAEQLLDSKSSVQCSVTYKHGYCPVTINDCVLLNYKRAGLKNIRARVTRQSIECVPGCPVEETAIFMKNLWR